MKIKKIISTFYICILLFNISLTGQSDSLFQNNNEWEAFPIFNYDSDVGFGYGGKGFLYNFLNSKESFDLTLYNSTKGERWYRFVFSMVDMQRRQGKKYPFAVDIITDYDKWINSKYYFSLKDEVKTYKKEVLEITALLSKGFNKNFVAEFGLRIKNYNSFGFNPLEELNETRIYPFESTSQHIQTATLLLNCRWDTRTNFINSQNGIVIESDNEYTHFILPKSSDWYFKFSFLLQSYTSLFNTDFVLANRLLLQFQTNVSNYLLLIPIGGNSTLRGLPQDRYLNKSVALINTELRFPIWRRFGGIAGVDIGNGDKTPDWILNPVTGLRFYMDNFVVRFDIGFGKETTGIYFNFGHIF